MTAGSGVVRRAAPSLLVLIVLIFVQLGPSRAVQAESALYLPVGSVDAEALIGPPPKIGSPAFKEQMAVVLWLQRTRTAQEVAFVEKVLDVERFAPILGASLFTVDAAALKALIDDAIDEVRRDYDALKGVYDLPRPFQVNDAVKPVGDARPVASYPSGHAIRAMVYARLLADVFPEHKDALLDLAYRVGYGRVVAGVHYPVDIISGQKLGNAYADAIIDGQAFKDAVARLKAD